jgi:hypothetical protein
MFARPEWTGCLRQMGVALVLFPHERSLGILSLPVGVHLLPPLQPTTYPQAGVLKPSAWGCRGSTE